jgi:hypothetical protein
MNDLTEHTVTVEGMCIIIDGPYSERRHHNLFQNLYASRAMSSAEAFSILRVHIAASLSPMLYEGLSVGPVVDGHQTFYGSLQDVPDGWWSRIYDQAHFSNRKPLPHEIMGHCMAQCYAPSKRRNQVNDHHILIDPTIMADAAWLARLACTSLWSGDNMAQRVEEAAKRVIAAALEED